MADQTQPRSRLRKPAALVAALLIGLSALPARAESAEEKFERAYELAGVDEVRIQNVNGPIELMTWDRAYLRVTAYKRAKGSRAEERLKETEIRVVKAGSKIDIETILPKRGRFLGLFSFSDGRSIDVSYEIRLPPSTAVEVETVNGRISAEKRTGTLSLNTVNGSVRVEAHEAPLHVNTVNGSVEVAFVGPIRPADVETVNGSVTVWGSKESSIRYELQTVNGKIRSDFAGLTVEGKWGPREARGTFNGGKERLSVGTVNGEVRILAADASISLPRLR